jgi:hypothetical protein
MRTNVAQLRSKHPDLREQDYWLWPDGTVADIPSVGELPWPADKHIKRLKPNR